MLMAGSVTALWVMCVCYKSLLFISPPFNLQTSTKYFWFTDACSACWRLSVSCIYTHTYIQDAVVISLPGQSLSSEDTCWLVMEQHVKPEMRLLRRFDKSDPEQEKEKLLMKKTKQKQNNQNSMFIRKSEVFKFVCLTQWGFVSHVINYF